MPKRKAASSSNNNPSHRHKKHPRLSNNNNTDETPTEQQPAHLQSQVNIPYTDPSTLTTAQIIQQKTIVSQKLHHAIKLVSRALKVGRGFERQRLGKKLKLAKEGNDEVLVGRVEREMGVLKDVELDGVARGVVRKGLGKRVKGWRFFPVEEWAEKGIEGGKEVEEGDEEVKKARNNVIAALCNMKPVREAVKTAVEMVRDVAETKWAPGGDDGHEEEEEGEEKRESEAVKRGDRSPRNRNGEEDENEDDDEEPEEEWSEWNGIEDSINYTIPSPPTEDNIGKGNTSRSKSKPSIKSDISLIDPSRHADDEWSGEEDDIEAGYIEDLEADEESDEAGEEEQLSEDELIEIFIAPGSDSEEAEDREEDSDDTTTTTTTTTITVTKKTIPKPPITPSKKSKPKSTPSRSPSPSPASSITTKPKPKPKPLPTTTKSTFLPSLMAGYISGSDSDSAFNDPFHPSKKHSSAAAQKKQRKNRMGQQARRALAERKYKDNARHIKLGLGSGKREDMDGGRSGASRGGFGRGVGGAGGLGRGRFAGGEDDGAGRSKKVDRKKDTDGPLHPSWEAARKAKEVKAKAEFQGKKIKFD